MEQYNVAVKNLINLEFFRQLKRVVSVEILLVIDQNCGILSHWWDLYLGWKEIKV